MAFLSASEHRNAGHSLVWKTAVMYKAKPLWYSTTRIRLLRYETLGNSWLSAHPQLHRRPSSHHVPGPCRSHRLSVCRILLLPLIARVKLHRAPHLALPTVSSFPNKNLPRDPPPKGHLVPGRILECPASWGPPYSFEPISRLSRGYSLAALATHDA